MKGQNNNTSNDTVINIEQSEMQELITSKPGKHIYKSEKNNFLLQEFKSKELISDVDDQKAKLIDALRNAISSYLFEYLEGFHIPTHYVKKYSETKMMIKETESLPITVRVINSISGNTLKRLGLKDAVSTEFPILEHYLSTNQNGKSWINEYHVYAFSIATPDEFKQINRIASKTNAVLRGLCERRQLNLSDLQLEFGRYNNNQIVLIGELSPTTCHFLDNSTEFKTKRDRFMLDSENAVETITELYNRLLLKV